MSKRFVAAVVVTLILVGLLVWSQQRRDPWKVSGFIESDEIRLGSRVGGRVSRVHVIEGQVVHLNEALVEL